MENFWKKIVILFFIVSSCSDGGGGLIRRRSSQEARVVENIMMMDDQVSAPVAKVTSKAAALPYALFDEKFPTVTDRFTITGDGEVLYDYKDDDGKWTLDKDLATLTPNTYNIKTHSDLILEHIVFPSRTNNVQFQPMRFPSGVLGILFIDAKNNLKIVKQSIPKVFTVDDIYNATLLDQNVFFVMTRLVGTNFYITYGKNDGKTQLWAERRFGTENPLTFDPPEICQDMKDVSSMSKMMAQAGEHLKSQGIMLVSTKAGETNNFDNVKKMQAENPNPIPSKGSSSAPTSLNLLDITTIGSDYSNAATQMGNSFADPTSARGFCQDIVGSIMIGEIVLNPEMNPMGKMMMLGMKSSLADDGKLSDSEALAVAKEKGIDTSSTTSMTHVAPFNPNDPKLLGSTQWTFTDSVGHLHRTIITSETYVTSGTTQTLITSDITITTSTGSVISSTMDDYVISVTPPDMAAITASDLRLATAGEIAAVTSDCAAGVAAARAKDPSWKDFGTGLGSWDMYASTFSASGQVPGMGSSTFTGLNQDDVPDICTTVETFGGFYMIKNGMGPINQIKAATRGVGKVAGAIKTGYQKINGASDSAASYVEQNNANLRDTFKAPTKWGKFVNVLKIIPRGALAIVSAPLWPVRKLQMGMRYAVAKTSTAALQGKNAAINKGRGIASALDGEVKFSFAQGYRMQSVYEDYQAQLEDDPEMTFDDYIKKMGIEDKNIPKLRSKVQKELQKLKETYGEDGFDDAKAKNAEDAKKAQEDLDNAEAKKIQLEDESKAIQDELDAHNLSDSPVQVSSPEAPTLKVEIANANITVTPPTGPTPPGPTPPGPTPPGSTAPPAKEIPVDFVEELSDVVLEAKTAAYHREQAKLAAKAKLIKSSADPEFKTINDQMDASNKAFAQDKAFHENLSKIGKKISAGETLTDVETIQFTEGLRDGQEISEGRISKIGITKSFLNGENSSKMLDLYETRVATIAEGNTQFLDVEIGHIQTKLNALRAANLKISGPPSDQLDWELNTSKVEGASDFDAKTKVLQGVEDAVVDSTPIPDTAKAKFKEMKIKDAAFKAAQTKVKETLNRAKTTTATDEFPDKFKALQDKIAEAKKIASDAEDKALQEEVDRADGASKQAAQEKQNKMQEAKRLEKLQEETMKNNVDKLIEKVRTNQPLGPEDNKLLNEFGQDAHDLAHGKFSKLGLIKGVLTHPIDAFKVAMEARAQLMAGGKGSVSPKDMGEIQSQLDDVRAGAPKGMEEGALDAKGLDKSLADGAAKPGADPKLQEFEKSAKVVDQIQEDMISGKSFKELSAEERGKLNELGVKDSADFEKGKAGIKGTLNEAATVETKALTPEEVKAKAATSSDEVEKNINDTSKGYNDLSEDTKASITEEEYNQLKSLEPEVRKATVSAKVVEVNNRAKSTPVEETKAPSITDEASPKAMLKDAKLAEEYRAANGGKLPESEDDVKKFLKNKQAVNEKAKSQAAKETERTQKQVEESSAKDEQIEKDRVRKAKATTSEEQMDEKINKDPELKEKARLYDESEGKTAEAKENIEEAPKKPGKVMETMNSPGGMVGVAAGAGVLMAWQQNGEGSMSAADSGKAASTGVEQIGVQSLSGVSGINNGLAGPLCNGDWGLFMSNWFKMWEAMGNGLLDMFGAGMDLLCKGASAWNNNVHSATTKTVSFACSVTDGAVHLVTTGIHKAEDIASTVADVTHAQDIGNAIGGGVIGQLFGLVDPTPAPLKPGSVKMVHSPLRP